jgi:hypothetical protein
MICLVFAAAGITNIKKEKPNKAQCTLWGFSVTVTD